MTDPIERTAAQPAPFDFRPTVAAIVTTYNHAHFVGDALQSIFGQTHPIAEVIVVDDGSTDHPEEVISAWPNVRLIRQHNSGLAAARNAGLAAATSHLVLFLDADDLLHPIAVAAGLACFEREPSAAFVYGAHRRVNASGAPEGGKRYTALVQGPATPFLEGNLVGMHATVLYRRTILMESGGFDTSLERCEDYDVYLRLSQHHAVSCHPRLVADYRWHETNMSHDVSKMLRSALLVHSRYKPKRHENDEYARWSTGGRRWRQYYAMEAARYAFAMKPAALIGVGMQAPFLLARAVAGRLIRTITARLPRTVDQIVRRFRKEHTPGLGCVRFGDLSEVRPISSNFGWDRGTPVDRRYIERFLEGAADKVRGRVLEIGDDTYSAQFGGRRILHQDVLHVHAGNPSATIVGDLCDPGVLPSNFYDCIILTQTLHLIFDMPLALRHLFRALRPGGSLLITVPGITPVDLQEWRSRWYWSMTPIALKSLLEQHFERRQCAVTHFGNVFAATAFLQGVVCEELEWEKLDYCDGAYPIVVAAVATRGIT